MKKIYSFSLIMLAFLFLASCDKDFEDMNKSKTSPTVIDPAFLLNNAVISSSAPSGTLQYDLGIVQQIISPNSGVIVGANFNQVNIANTPVIWQNYFQNVIKYTRTVISVTAEDPARSNLMNMARIIQANAFMMISDTYGNIPYEEAGVGYIEQNFFPAYETQQSIYPKIISELTAATAALNASGRVETADVLYAGNIDKWRKFGYSLLLRAGMRLSKIDPAVAQATALAAANGGVITTNADNAVIRHDANYANGVGNTLNSTEAANYYLAAPFVNALKAKNDPRLASIAVRYVGATSGPEQTAAKANFVPANQFGLPMGSDDVTADAAGAGLPGGGKRYAFTQLDRTRMGSRLSPMYMVTAAQTNLLLAEARFRGWISTGTAAGYFDAGIRANMDALAGYGTASAVPAADRDLYATTRAAAFVGSELAEINYEYWVASFLNGPEAWANFRRSGYPALAPNPYPGRTVPFITRLTYPASEILVNKENVQAAISAMGGDNLDTRVWWDKP
jgi:Starch-binding associating with outer membrane